MNPTHITAKVKDILSEHLRLDESEIFPASSLQEDLGADSLDLVEIIMTLEEEFDLYIPDRDAERLVTVQDVVSYIIDNAA